MHDLRAQSDAVALLSCTVRLRDGAPQAEQDAAAKALAASLEAACAALSARAACPLPPAPARRFPPFRERAARARASEARRAMSSSPPHTDPLAPASTCRRPSMQRGSRCSRTRTSAPTSPSPPRTAAQRRAAPRPSPRPGASSGPRRGGGGRGARASLRHPAPPAGASQPARPTACPPAQVFARTEPGAANQPERVWCAFLPGHSSPPLLRHPFAPRLAGRGAAPTPAPPLRPSSRSRRLDVFVEVAGRYPGTVLDVANKARPLRLRHPTRQHQGLPAPRWLTLLFPSARG